MTLNSLGLPNQNDYSAAEVTRETVYDLTDSDNDNDYESLKGKQ
jgi:hypothetical protein